MSKPIIAIVGPSGSGKSTSLRNIVCLPTTRTLDLERKGWPFKTSGYDIRECESLVKFDNEFKLAKEDPKVNTIIIESYPKHNEMVLTMSHMVSNGDGFKTYAQVERMTGAFLDKLKCDKTVIVTAIDEIVRIPNVDGTENVARRIATKGRAWEGKIEKEFLMVLFTQIVKNKDGKITYNFQTNTDGNTSAKTPMGMFPEPLVENDMKLVLQRMEEYYK